MGRVFFIYALFCIYCSVQADLGEKTEQTLLEIPALALNDTTTNVNDEPRKMVLPEVLKNTSTEGKPTSEAAPKIVRSIPNYAPVALPKPYAQPALYASAPPSPSYSAPALSYAPQPYVPCYNSFIESCSPVLVPYPCGASSSYAAALTAPQYRTAQPVYQPPQPAYRPPPQPAYRPRPQPAYQPRPQPVYQPPPPVYKPPQHIYTAPAIQSYSAPVKCGGNILLGCNPSVAPVPCSSYSPSY